MIDREFNKVFPPLLKEEYEALEKSVIEGGCREPLTLWGEILIDGHNRHDICLKHSIPFETRSMEFDSRDAALTWMIRNQIGRRNLNTEQRNYLIGLQYEAEKNAHGGDRKSSGQNAHLIKDKTAEQIAQQHGVHEKTVRRNANFANAVDRIGEVSAEAKAKILSGQSGTNKKTLAKLASAPNEEITKIAQKIEEGEKITVNHEKPVQVTKRYMSERESELHDYKPLPALLKAQRAMGDLGFHLEHSLKKVKETFEALRTPKERQEIVEKFTIHCETMENFKKELLA